jgi:nicotinate-nucleotide adenylyltransferase
MKIAIFSGSFNPIHNGHLAIASEVLNEGIAEEVWFLVSPQNPLKKRTELIPEQQRLEMVLLAIENEPGMKASDIEFNLPRPSYTIRTLEKLKSDNPQHQFSLLIGGDNLAILHKWVEYERIIGEFGLIVYPRPGFPIPTDLNYQNTITLSAPLLDCSATEIRERVRSGMSIADMVPEKVAKYLKLRDDS